MKKIYFDHSATTPLASAVLEKMKPYFSEKYGNASSLHFFGQEAKAALEEARNMVAYSLNCKEDEIIFTSGGTEGNNLFIKGVAFNLFKKKFKGHFHIITAKIEHHAILHTVKQLEELFGFEVTYLDVDKNGVVDIEVLKKEIKNNTCLISVMYANNEVGTIQPIAEISKIITNEKKNRSIACNKLPIYFHTDAVQAGSYLDIDINGLGVDALSLSAHKFYGPKGSGVLFLRKGAQIEPMQTGGGHERRLRSGTENIPGIIGFAEALKIAQDCKKENSKKIGKIRDYLIENLIKKVDGIILTGHPQKRLPNLASFMVKRVEGESMLIHLDLKGIAVSTGSACSSGSLKPSHVLQALNVSREEIQGSLRISLGNENTKEDVDYFLSIFPEIVRKLREISAI